MEDEIEALIFSVALGTDWRAEFARRWSLLPVYRDPGGVLALDREREVFSWGHDSSRPPSPEENPGLRLMALKLASSQYPELVGLEPVRPSNAVTCERCGGAGRLHVADSSIPCGECSSLGWQAARPFA